MPVVSVFQDFDFGGNPVRIYGSTCSNPFACLFLPRSNTGRLHLDQLQWQDDFLVVYLAHQKNNQQGKWAAFLRHLFCNPFKKYVCPVFSLAHWLALNEEMRMSGGPIFPSSNRFQPEASVQ
jgi:hypothetical protein